MSENQIAISLNNVSKRFRIEKPKNRIQSLPDRFRMKKDMSDEKYKDVLINVDLDIAKGEAVAIFGRNGSGKSTILKLISSIMYPDEGEVKAHGEIASLLELGAGFNPEQTGYENIFLYGSIHGRKKKEIESRLEEIIEFSEIGEYIYAPVRTYSSGMKARLAFSVSININPDILLIDEILAVGDVGFRQKCLKQIEEIRAHGTTIVIVTHNTNLVKGLCNRAVWIKDGKKFRDGTFKNVTEEYTKFMSK